MPSSSPIRKLGHILENLIVAMRELLYTLSNRGERTANKEMTRKKMKLILNMNGKMEKMAEKLCLYPWPFNELSELPGKARRRARG